MKKIFLTGGSSGIGLACSKLLCTQFEVFAPSRKEFDLENFELVNNYNLSEYDIIINCAGNNIGTYQGFHHNSWQNQSRQVNVNFVAPLLLAKRYTQDRQKGQFIYISSISADRPETYNVFLSTSKLALRVAIDTMSKSFTGIKFTEICPGRTRTNMLHQNYNGSKSKDEIEKEYDQLDCLSADQVANSVLYSIYNQVTEIKITP